MEKYNVEILTLVSRADGVGDDSNYAKLLKEFFWGKGYEVNLLSSKFEDIKIRYKLSKLPCEKTKCMVLNFEFVCNRDACGDIEWLYGKFRDKVLLRSSEFDYVRSIEKLPLEDE